jgi:hypothetical protein
MKTYFHVAFGDRSYGVGDEYGELSNFAPYPISLDGKRWPTSEHYFQAQKFLDPKRREEVRRGVDGWSGADARAESQEPAAPGLGGGKGGRDAQGRAREVRAAPRPCGAPGGDR